MKNKVLNIVVVGLLLVMLLPFNVVAANFVLQDQGTDAKHKTTKELIDYGDLEINIYDNATGGNLIHTETFIDVINDGYWSVKLGTNPSNPLSLDYSTPYWKDYKINGEDVDFYDNYGNITERDLFYSPFGNINTSWITSGVLDWARLPIIYEANITDLKDYVLDNGDSINGIYDFNSGLLYIDNNSNKVGIGTTAPSEKLEVNGTLYANLINTGMGNTEIYLMNQNLQTTDSPTFKQLTLTQPIGIQPLIITSNTKVNNLNADLLDGYNSSDFQLKLTNPVTGLGTVNSISKWVSAGTIGGSNIYEVSGNVGIGISDPSNKLNVLGDGNFTGVVYSDGSPVITYINEGNLNVNSANYWDGLNTPADINAGDITDDNTYLLAVGDTATGTYNFNSGLLFIDSASNRIGIGTATPSYKLHINGSLYADAINTGQGNTEVYLMNQNLQTTDSPTFTRLTLSQATGTAPLTVSSTTLVNNLNADLLDGQHGSYYLPASTYTAADVLTKIKTVDGSGSGLDADLLDGHDTSYFQTALTNPVTGTGTANYIPKLTGTSTIGNSIIYETGGNVGIGTTNPNFHLTVTDGSIPEPSSVSIISGPTISVQGDGKAYFMGRDVTNDIEFIMGTSSSGVAFAGAMTAHDFALRTNNVDRIIIEENTGNVGIGTTTPSAKLDVNGNFEVNGNKFFVNATSGQVGIGVTPPSGGYAKVYIGGTPANPYLEYAIYAISDEGIYSVGSPAFLAEGDYYGIEAYGNTYAVYAKGNYNAVSGTYGVGVYGEGNPGVYGKSVASAGSGVIGSGPSGGYDFYAAGAGTDYGTSSSIRWKTNITQIQNALDKVLNLEGVYFNWNNTNDTNNAHDMGLIAEEVGEIVPEVVVYENEDNESNWYIDNETGEKKLYASGLDYGALTPLLIEAIKEQQEIINQQNETIELMKEDLCELGIERWC